MQKHYAVINTAKLNPSGGEGSSQLGLWRNFFWFDPAVKPAELASLPLSHDWTDFGLYVARSGWTAKDSFFGLRCGPFIGETGAKLMGAHTMNGHGHPDQGNITFHWGDQAVLPGSNYARIKNTSMHNLVVFEGVDRDKGKLVGQLGSGVPWYGMGGAGKQVERPGTLLGVRHHADYHTYLCDLGGLYKVADSREPSKFFFPRYLRSVTYLPKGVVIIIDRVDSPHPRNIQFRLLTAARDLAVAGKDFTFTVKGVPGRIVDFSRNESFTRSAAPETIFVWGDVNRQVATLTAPEARSATFAVVIGMNGAEKGVTVETTPTGALIKGATTQPLAITWPAAPDKKP